MKQILFLLSILIISIPASASKPCSDSKTKLCTINGKNFGFPSTSIENLIKLIKKFKNHSSSSKTQNFKTLNNYFDFDFMAKAALQSKWKTLTNIQKNKYSVLFKQMLKHNYIKKLHKHKNFKITIKSEKLKGKRARVGTELSKINTSNEVPIKIVYKMRKTSNGWLIYDVITDEVSLVKNYRSIFKRLIKQKGFNHLLNYLKKQSK